VAAPRGRARRRPRGRPSWPVPAGATRGGSGAGIGAGRRGAGRRGASWTPASGAGRRRGRRDRPWRMWCGGRRIGGFLWRGGAREVWLASILFPAVDLAWPAVPPFFLCLFGGHGRRTPGWIVAVGCFVIDEMEGSDCSRDGDATDNFLGGPGSQRCGWVDIHSLVVGNG
jgi:hypothetical protein